MAIITDSDLASYLRQPDADVALYTDLANGVVGDLIGAVDPVPTRIKAITLEVGARAFRNPNGYSSETVDDYTYRRDADTRQAGVYLTDAERAELLTLAGKGQRTFYTVGLTSPLDVP
jgi:uncharacterized protein (DUF58 family)